jgi:hypothetical protein
MSGYNSIEYQRIGEQYIGNNFKIIGIYVIELLSYRNPE